MKKSIHLLKSFNMSKMTYFLSMLMLFITMNGFSQTYDVNIHVTDGSTGLASASVTLNSTTMTTNSSGNVTFTGIANGTYTYTASLTCYINGTDSVTVNGSNINDTITLQPETNNNVFFFITEGGPMASLGATVKLFNANNSYTFVTSDPFGGEMIANVPYGSYQYSISKTCFQTDTGSVVVDCNNGQGISVFSDLKPDTANNVFFFITEGGPMASLGATVKLFNANNSYTFVTSDPFGGEMIANVPYGNYQYSISKTCFQTDTGSVVIDCNNGQGISVFSTLKSDTANNVFFFITEGGPMASLGATVKLFNANNSYTFVTSDPFGGEMIANVPYGNYQYSISKTCFQTDTGSVVIDCNNGQGISVFSTLKSDTANNVFFFITEGGPMASLGATVKLFNANNSFSFVTSDPFGGEMIANVPYGKYQYSISKTCFQTDTGSVVIDCNAGQGISVFSTLKSDTANNAFFFVTEGGPMASLGATVKLFNANNSFSFVTSDPFGGEMIANVPYGKYQYSISKTCFQTDTGSVVIDCNAGQGISVFSTLKADTANNAFFFITEGGPMASLGATVKLFNANNSFSFVTSDPFGGEMIANVPYGTYQYSISKTCFQTDTGSVVIDCNAGQGISVFSTLKADTANNAFFFITEGGPMASIGATVKLFNANNSYTFVTSDPFGGEMIANVPYGKYQYSISKTCFQTDTGSVVIDCNNGQGISVFSTLKSDTANNVFFFITEGGPMASLGATVKLFNANNSFSFVTSDPFGGEMIANVPYGTYQYSISKPCFQTDTGSVVVDCNAGQGISVFSTLKADTANNAFFFITEGGPMASLGATVKLFNTNNSFSFVTSDPFGGEMIANVPYGTYQYSVSKPCFQTDTGSVVIDCNAGQGISVFSTLTAIVIKEDVTDSMCDGDTYIFGTQTLTKAGTYTEIFVSAAGCDSTVNLTLSLITINTNVTSAGKTLTADIAGAQYQWVDCDNGFASIAGETDQVFVAAQNGNYAVIITYNGCTDTSACYPVTSVGIEDKQFDLDITLFPNPVADNLVIDWGENTGTVELKIMQLNGRLLITETLLNTSKTSIDVSGLVQGFYLIEINIDGNRSIQKFIKQ
jgi:uncharacterized membrane protein